MQYNPDKFKAAVHYVCRTCYDKSKLNTTKLHKILWLADILAYKNMGEAITCEVYKKNQYGPFSTHLDSVIKELTQAGRMHVREIEWAEGKIKREFIAKGEPDTSLFSRDELRMLDDMSNYITDGHTAASISEKTHDDLWEMALMHEPIPYEAVLVSKLAPISNEDIEWAKSEIERNAE